MLLDQAEMEWWLMDDPAQRKKLESILQSKILHAQDAIKANPSLQKMAEQLRSLYKENQEDFLFALGAGPPPPSMNQPQRPKVPPSKIPQLLYILNAISTGNPITMPPSLKLDPGGMPVSLENTTLEVITNASELENQKPKSPARRKSMIQEINEINELEKQIQQAEEDYWEIKRDEAAIHGQQGKYAIAMERLRGERLLRELPGTIERLKRQKDLLEKKLSNQS